VVEVLAGYDWPGNIRELVNVMERAVVLADGPAVTLGDLPVELRAPRRRGLRPRLPAPTPAGSSATAPGRLVPPTVPVRPTGHSAAAADGAPWEADDPRSSAGEDWNAEFVSYERQRLIDALSDADGNKSVAARLLGMPRSTFFSKLKKHGIG
jgi:transcriptional regulator of acetoin/glycerol metabolism